MPNPATARLVGAARIGAAIVCVLGCATHRDADHSAAPSPAGADVVSSTDAGTAPNVDVGGGWAKTETVAGTSGSTPDRGDVDQAPEQPWCCLQQDLKWYVASAAVLYYLRLTRTGTLERRPVVDTREWTSGYVASDAERAAAGTAVSVRAVQLPSCDQGRLCLRDVRDALAHPDVTSLLPDGHHFPNGMVTDGAVMAVFVGETVITFGAPPFPDLPQGLEALHALLLQLEHEHEHALQTN